MSQIKPAIVCLGYNRPDSMCRLLHSIGNGIYNYDDITLVISIDKSCESEKVYSVAEEFDWKHGKKCIIKHNSRLGGKEHALRCGDLTSEYDAIIYLEDDVVVAPNFYSFTTKALDRYGNDENVFGIALYSQKQIFGLGLQFNPVYNGSDAFLFKGDVSWGQCWTKKSWSEFRNWYDERNGKLDDYCKNIPLGVYDWSDDSSWSKYIEFYMVERNKYYIVPYYSYSTCMSDGGVHTNRSSDQCQVPLSSKIDDEYVFYSFDECVKYDSFREVEEIGDICGISSDDICVDLNGLKYDWSGYRYLLSVKRLPYEIVHTYGSNFDPVENNIYFDAQGDTIVLYRIPDNYLPPKSIMEIPKYKLSNGRRDRLLDRFLLSQLVPYTISRCLTKILNR